MASDKQEPHTETALDHEIVAFLESTVLFQFSLNSELLYNWQTELSDVATDACSLSDTTRHEIVLQRPPGPIYFTANSVESIYECLRKLEDLDPEVYREFKLIIHEVLFCALTWSFAAKIQLFRHGLLEVLLETFLRSIKSLTPIAEDQQWARYLPIARLLGSFLDLGCNSKQFKRLFSPLFASSSQVSAEAKKATLEVLFYFLETCPTSYSALSFNNISNGPLVIPINDESEVSATFTVSTWFKLPEMHNYNSESEDLVPLTLFSLANSSDRDSLIFQIRLCNDKFSVNILNQRNGSKRQFSFNHVLKCCTQNQGFTHFVLTYDSYQNLNLYIDGEYSESIPSSAISKADIHWNKLYIGDPSDPADRECLTSPDRHDLLVKDLSVMNVACKFEWISLFYFLGMGYDWSQKEFSVHNIHEFLDRMSRQNYVLMSYRAADVLRSRSEQKSYSGDARQKLMQPKRSTSISSPSFSLPSKAEIVNLLANAKLSTANFLFDTNNTQFIEFVANSRGHAITYHKFDAFCASLSCWGGSGLLLTMIELMIRDEYDDPRHRDLLFFESSRLLLSCLQKDSQMNREFESNDGYEALALLIDYYKMSFNVSLEFEDRTKYQLTNLVTKGEFGPQIAKSSYLSMLINFAQSSAGIGHLISNTSAFRVLVSNFDLFSNTPSFSNLQSHICSLMATERYKHFNIKELTKTKILKRLLQHTKISLIEGSDEDRVDRLMMILTTLIESELTSDSIRLISNFVIFALYNESTGRLSQKAGLGALSALTNTLCGSESSVKSLKKFSRSISIHWILLLLDFAGDSNPMSAKVVCCAIALLSKFLRVLGTHVIKRFFKANKGLHVLGYFLQDWWNNDNVASVLFMNAFRSESGDHGSCLPCLPELARNKHFTRDSNSTPIPDFINMLNKLALTGIVRLGQKQGKVLSTPSSPVKSLSTKASLDDHISELSFDVTHLLYQMADMIEIGFSDSAALQVIFLSKEWLEGAFEIIAHLKVLSNKESSDPPSEIKASFEACLNRYVSVLSFLFISMLLDVKKMLDIMKYLNDITKKLMIDTIFPKIFEHINGFICNSAFIFKELEFVRGATEVLNIYHNEFLLQNYFISRDNLESYKTCLVAIIEASDTKSNLRHQLGPNLGHALLMQLSTISHTTQIMDNFDDISESEFAQDLDQNVRFCLNKQVLILHPQVLNVTSLRSAIELIMGNFLKLSPQKQLDLSGHTLNFLRSTIVMRQEDFEQIKRQLTQVSDYQNSSEILSEFFTFLATHNDEETVKYIQKFPTVRHIFNKNFHFRLSKLRDIGRKSVKEMMQVVLNSGGHLGNVNSVQLQSFEKDCQTLKAATVAQEVTKYNRDLQDLQENTQIHSTSYEQTKTEVYRLLNESPMKDTNYTLDYIEGANRMRMLLVSEDQLHDSEKLSYTVKVPSKKLKAAHVSDDSALSPESVFSSFAIQDSVFLDPSGLEVDLNEYEEIDEYGESHSNTRIPNEDRNRKVLRSLYLGDQIQALYNVSKVNGLDAVESLMILGYSHLYFIENYFHCSDGNVVDINEVSLESRDPYLQFIKPQCTEDQGNRVYRTKTWSLKSFACVCKRKFLLRDIALELFFDDGASHLITCLSTKERDSIYDKLSPYSANEHLDKDLQITLDVSSSHSSQQTPNSSSGYYLKSRLVSAFSTNFTKSSTFSEITKKWRQGKMSNFYYLLSINTMAGRTFNDLTQYPIFPWVLADYESPKLDLSDPKSFRDLSKPMGAQAPKRAQEYRERFDALASINDSNAPPFHYGTHYSSAMIVTSYLIRLKPYVQSYLLLQGGKFDHADRLFNSVSKTWSSASKENTTDVRELTPEFFYLPEFLENRNLFEFGKLQNGESSNDVALPKWAKNDPKLFIAKNREALESAYVSANLHHWIDLIFGFKQSGEEAVKALNVFHHSSYDGAINLDMIKDETEKRAIIGMINNFGQTPLKLFSKPHPAKVILNVPYVQISLSDTNRKAPVCTFESKLHRPIEKLEISSKTKKWIGRPACTSYEDQTLIRRPMSGQQETGSGSLHIQTSLFMNLCSSNITCILQIGNKYFVTGSQDGLIQVWKYSQTPSPNVTLHSVLRGHSSAIKTLCYSKLFKVCLSVDAEGGILQWDFTRFKFIRRITKSSTLEHSRLVVAISNDTGNFCTVSSTKYNNVLTAYTLNGEKYTQITLRPGQITAVAIAQANDALVESMSSEYHHSYWTDEYIVLSYSSPQISMQVYKLHAGDQGWLLSLLQEASIHSLISGHVTAMSVLKQTESSEEERLIRGKLMFVIGDSKGRVYVW